MPTDDEDIADDVTLDDLDFDDFEAWDAPPAPSGPKVKFIPYDDPPKPISAIRPGISRNCSRSWNRRSRCSSGIYRSKRKSERNYYPKRYSKYWT